VASQKTKFDGNRSLDSSAEHTASAGAEAADQGGKDCGHGCGGGNESSDERKPAGDAIFPEPATCATRPGHAGDPERDLIGDD
jgi:hypothetical protein